MAKQTAVYVEPESYFNADRKRAMKEFKQKKAAKERAAKSSTKKK